MAIFGFALVILEVYLPGFGLPGISGIICLLAGIALKAKTDVMTWLVMTLIVAALLCLALTFFLRAAAKGKLGYSRFVLKEVATQKVDANDLDFYLGKSGLATTVLRPTGNAEIEGAKLNVISDGEYIPEGCKIVVTKVEGNRILVRKA